MKGELIVLLELGLFYLMVVGAALWQLRSVSGPTKEQGAKSGSKRIGE